MGRFVQHFIKTVNKWVEEGSLAGTKHEVIDIKWIQRLRDLDTASNLNRDPAFIQEMVATAKNRPKNSWKNLTLSWEPAEGPAEAAPQIGRWSEIRSPRIAGP